MNFKKRLLINISIPLVICFVLIASLIFLSSNISQKTEKIKQQKGELSFHLQSTESLALLSKDFEKSKKYIAQLESILPDRDKLITLPRNIGVIANQSQIDLNSTLGKEESSQNQQLRETDIVMNGQGPIDNFINFLKAVENSLYLIKFNEFDLSRTGEEFKISIKGRVFSK
ncbi:type 4a pilus biogenesis protein PilO [Candidatus Wolfebacteria bacterium]|nr:type 4a pilus biogenesis protein PilO [Candidatus Wolfebacteria bacterium]